ncbi:hypothetical protein ABZ848_38825 [Streptomyces sp. NPDC047081]|uniref:hypothetical protein n=1 Tax=Streptomyces sp. NPDC047081 TaxID=3154706 RepID=UPI0033CEBADD
MITLEVTAATGARSGEASAGVRVDWFSRDDEDVRPGAVALDAVCRGTADRWLLRVGHG